MFFWFDNSVFLNVKNLKEDGGTYMHPRVCTSIAQERVSLLANGEMGVFPLGPHTIHQERKNTSSNINLLLN